SPWDGGDELFDNFRDGKGYIEVFSNHSFFMERAVCPPGYFECPGTNLCCTKKCGVVCDSHCCEVDFEFDSNTQNLIKKDNNKCFCLNSEKLKGDEAPFAYRLHCNNEMEQVTVDEIRNSEGKINEYLNSLEEVVQQSICVEVKLILTKGALIRGGNLGKDLVYEDPVIQSLAFEDVNIAFSKTRIEIINVFRELLNKVNDSNKIDVERIINSFSDFSRSKYETLTNKALSDKSINNSCSTLQLPPSCDIVHDLKSPQDISAYYGLGMSIEVKISTEN
ncbi:13598_t:CDS:2, partial [Entrophospora sp. SA101]